LGEDTGTFRHHIIESPFRSPPLTALKSSAKDRPFCWASNPRNSRMGGRSGVYTMVLQAACRGPFKHLATRGKRGQVCVCVVHVAWGSGWRRPGGTYAGPGTPSQHALALNNPPGPPSPSLSTSYAPQPQHARTRGMLAPAACSQHNSGPTETHIPGSHHMQRRAPCKDNTWAGWARGW
jgi:hypothetical protein